MQSHNSQTRTRVFFAVIALMLCLVSRSAIAQSFVVIVNDGNPTKTINKEQVANLFLKRATKWSDGMLVQPVDLPEAAPAREAFSAAVLHRSPAAMRAFWQQQIFAGRALPPVEKNSESEVVAFVRANPGAIAYVSAVAANAAGIKTLSVE